MSKKLLVVLSILSVFVATNVFAISITIGLTDQTGQKLANANCIATDTNQRAELFQTNPKGEATLNRVQGDLKVHCQQENNKKDVVAKYNTNTKKIEHMSKTETALFSFGAGGSFGVSF